MTISARTRAIVVALAASAAAAATIAATGWADEAQPIADSAAAEPVVDASSFSVLARAARSGDAMPEAVRKTFVSVATREQVDLDRARAVAASGLSSTWVIPGERRVCLALPDPVDGFGVNCRSYAEAATGALWVSLVGGPDQRVGDASAALLVPDGVKQVTAVGSDGSRRELAVADNAVVAELANASRLEFTGPDGRAASTAIPPTTPAMLASDG